MKIWIQDSSDGQFYFELSADNYRTLASSETYRNKSDAVAAAQLIKREAGSAVIYDLSKQRS